MKNKFSHYLLLLLCLAVIIAGLSAYITLQQKPADITKNQRPNILVVISDQQHYGAFGKIDDFFSTPNMDRLAGESIMFSQAMVTSPQCSPSRSSIYTGLYPHKTGVIGNTGSFDYAGNIISGLAGEYKTIGEYLRPAGYFTGYVGKWHLGEVGSHADGYDIGVFDTVVGGDITTDRQKSQAASEFLDAWKTQTSKPFALFLNYTDPHNIYDFTLKNKWRTADLPGLAPLPENYYKERQSDKPLSQRQYISQESNTVFQRDADTIWKKYREYYRQRVALLDRELGLILSKVKELGLWEDTIIIVTSDHGDMDAQHQLGYKGPFGYDALIRVPLIVHVPKKYAGIDPAAIDDLTVNVDLLPTILDFANISQPALDGKSLRPVLTGVQDEVNYQYVIGQYYNKRKWVHPLRMIRSQKYKLIDHLTGVDELYDLAMDPGEVDNKIEDSGYSDIRKELVHNLDLWIEEQADPFHELAATDPKGNKL